MITLLRLGPSKHRSRLLLWWPTAVVLDSRMNDREVNPPGFVISRLYRTAAYVVTMAGLAGIPRLAQANVYATNIKLNGGFTNAPAGAGTNVLISYVLNEAATTGVTVEIKQGSNIIRSLVFTNGAAGALKGTNSVVW